MADHDRWDDERERRDERPPRREGDFGVGRRAPHIGPTGIMNTAGSAGQWATSGRYFEDYDSRADYGGFEGGAPEWTVGPARPYAGAARPPPPNPRDRLRGPPEPERRERQADYGRGGYAPRPEGVGHELRSWRDESPVGDHRGRGPKGYKRPDQRIAEDVNDRLTDDPTIDASDVEVEVAGGEVTLVGFVQSRYAKRRAEDCAESVSGVSHVQNNLRVSQVPKPGSVGAQNDPRVAAVSDGHDADAAARHLGHDETR